MKLTRMYAQPKMTASHRSFLVDSRPSAASSTEAATGVPETIKNQATIEFGHRFEKGEARSSTGHRHPYRELRSGSRPPLQFLSHRFREIGERNDPLRHQHVHEVFDDTAELKFHLTKGTADRYKKNLDQVAEPERYFFRGPVSWTIRTYSKFMRLPATYSSRGSHFTRDGGSMSDGTI